VLDRVAFLTLVYNGHTLTLYVDGKPAATHAEPGPPDPGAKDTEIGGYASRATWNGAIDEVAVYGAALSPTTVSAHYRLGSLAGTAYPTAVTTTPGLVGYWRLDRTRSVHDSAGHARGTVVGKGIVHWYGLIAGSRDGAIALDGFGTELRLRGVPPLRGPFSIEAWVLPGPKVSNRTIVARPGAWYLRTDILGHWSGGFFHHKHIVAVTTAKLTARSPRPALPRPATRPGTSGLQPLRVRSGTGGGTSPVVSEVILMVVVGLAVGSIPVRRRRRRAAAAATAGETAPPAAAVAGEAVPPAAPAEAPD
jgi:hypothetical protein